MDYFGILKKAWDITWKYKALWVLGLFAGAGMSGSNSSTSSYQQNADQASPAAEQFVRWMGENVLLLAIIGGVIAVIALVFWVLSIAAQGGLVHGANEAAEGRKPALGASWGVGFSRWGRTFMIYFMLALPVIAVSTVMVLLFIALGVGGAASGDAGAGVAIVGGLCFVLPLFVVVLIAMSVIIGIVGQLAVRYGVLESVTFGAAIKRGWADLWGKRGAMVFWLVMLLPQVAMSVILLLFMVPFAVPMVVMFVKEQYIMAGGFAVLMSLVLLLPTAIYGTFVSSAWTVFFRQMTGIEPTAAALRQSPAPVYAAVPPAAEAPLPPVAEAAPEPALVVESESTALAAPEPEAAAAEEAVPEEPPVEEQPPSDV